MIKLDFEKYTKINDLTRRLSNVFNQVISLFNGVESRIKALENTSSQSFLTGEVKMWPSNTIPNGFLLCDGSAISRTTYATLFAVVGTTYGVGDGSTTFNLPPNGLTPRGAGTFTVNGRVKDGGTLGSILEDQMQKITGSITKGAANDAVIGGQAGANVSSTGSLSTATDRTGIVSTGSGFRSFSINFDSSTSPDARTSSATVGETRASSFAINFIIKT